MGRYQEDTASASAPAEMAAAWAAGSTFASVPSRATCGEYRAHVQWSHTPARPRDKSKGRRNQWPCGSIPEAQAEDEDNKD